MKLRTQIFLFLFLLGLVPLLAAFVINIPMIFDRLEGLYHKAYMQNLRAGFSDLDQHIARRHEMARLLAKMPEPGMLLSVDDADSPQAIDSARVAYVEWVNRVLFDQLDITRILFLDATGSVSYRLERNNKTARLEVQHGKMNGLNPELVEIGRKLHPGGVMTGPIIISKSAAQVVPNRIMQLSIISPIVLSVEAAEAGVSRDDHGLVIVYLDMSGLANAYRGIYWVHSDGRYLGLTDDKPAAKNAFDDFPGLEEIFKNRELGLWEFDSQQVLWAPLFDTESSGPIWVGRSVDPSPIAALRRTIEVRIATIAIGLLIVVFVIARLIAVRTERLGRDLTDGIAQVLERDEPVTFSWQRPQELTDLGKNLTRLAETHAEHNRALLDYARELEESNRYKSEFLANVSHELRTPLNSILLLSKMLAQNKAGKLTDEERKQARVIHDAGTDLTALIDNILDLSRIEARQMTLVTEPVDLRKTLSDVVELMRPQFDEKHLELKLDIDESAPESIASDKEKLRQILVNFLSNAVKFTIHGGVTVSLLPETGRKDSRFAVRISVADTGIGIPAGKRELVFEAFKQADGSTSRRFGGTGLGLTISRELARLIGGLIEVDSEDKKGSTFSLLLPAEMPVTREVTGAHGPGENAVTEVPAQTIPVADYNHARVLLVDDDMRNLLALTPLLEKWQLEVTAAGDGREALDTLASDTNFALVLMDIMMPEMSGYDVIRQLRSQPRFATLPIIALTAKAGEEDRLRCLQAGADDVIVKPVDLDELHTLVDKYLAGVPAVQPSGAQDI